MASDLTVSRLIGALAAAGPKALTTIRTARAEVRSRVWELAGANTPAADGHVIVDIDGVLVLAHSEWPTGMRLLVRKERPRPGAQLRFTDIDGNRLTCFATNTKGGPLADLELRFTAGGPAARTARTGSGWRSSPSHSTSSRGCRCSC